MLDRVSPILCRRVRQGKYLLQDSMSLKLKLGREGQGGWSGSRRSLRRVTRHGSALASSPSPPLFGSKRNRGSVTALRNCDLDCRVAEAQAFWKAKESKVARYRGCSEAWTTRVWSWGLGTAETGGASRTDSVGVCASCEFLREQRPFYSRAQQCRERVHLCGPSTSHFSLVLHSLRHKHYSWFVLFLLRQLQLCKVNWDLSRVR